MNSLVINPGGGAESGGLILVSEGVFENTMTADISGLAGDTDEMYRLIFMVRQAGGMLKIGFNDVTATDYNCAGMYTGFQSNGASNINPTRFSSASVGSIQVFPMSSQYSLVDLTISGKSDFPKQINGTVSMREVNTGMLQLTIAGAWTNTTSELTKINLIAINQQFIKLDYKLYKFG